MEIVSLNAGFTFNQICLMAKLAGHANESKCGNNKNLIDGKTRIQMHYCFTYFVPNN